MLERKVTCEDCGETYPPSWPHNCVRPSTDPLSSELSTGLDARLQRVGAAKGKLIYQAARCLTVLPLSEYSEDWSDKIPKSVLRQIEKQTDRLKDMAFILRKIADSI